ncbi:unnamed protein product [Boreogadus saida]
MSPEQIVLSSDSLATPSASSLSLALMSQRTWAGLSSADRRAMVHWFKRTGNMSANTLTHRPGNPKKPEQNQGLYSQLTTEPGTLLTVDNRSWDFTHSGQQKLGLYSELTTEPGTLLRADTTEPGTLLSVDNRTRDFAKSGHNRTRDITHSGQQKLGLYSQLTT